MSSVLFVPIHLDALSLANDQSLVGPMADFTRLPYFDGARDVNPDIAYLSEEFVSRPFENRTWYVKAGVHLHWALPDALTRGVVGADGTEFPVVPNRWLVTRSRVGAQGQATLEKQWIVESDYLYPDGAGAAAGSVSVPHVPGAAERRPFRFLGRNMPLAAWSKVDAAAQYFKPLTAVGYGEPSFAAFYPNCHSVFGFHDPDYAGALFDGLRYDVLGWYSASTLADTDDADDFLRSFVEKYPAADAARLVAALETDAGWTVALDDVVNWYAETQRGQVQTFLNGLKTAYVAAHRELPAAGEFIAKVSDELQLTPAAGSGGQFPSQMLCYASLTCGSSGGSLSNPAASDPNTKVAVGNSGTEALSALLAESIDPAHKPVIEDQLEALLLSSHLEHRQLDIGFKFHEARHEKGFTATSGGSLWTVTQETPGASAPANAPDADPLRQITLPPFIAHQLNALNLLQQRYDRSQQQLQALRRQLFSDWYKYMLSAYPPDGLNDDYPDPDEVRNYIETKGIAPLQRATDSTGELLLQGDASGAIDDASASGPAAGSLAATLAAVVRDLLRSLSFDTNPDLRNALKYKMTDAALASLTNAGLTNALLQSLSSLKSEAPLGKTDFLTKVSAKIGAAPTASYQTQILKAAQAVFYRLKLAPGPRFWQPNEPVVLLSGAAAAPTDRHGRDGELRDDGLLVCHLLPNTDLKNMVPSSFAAVTVRLEQMRTAAGADSFAFNVWRRNPWNPLLLEWEVEVFPVESQNNLRPLGEGYAPDFVNGSYTLDEDAVDLVYRSGRGAITKAANVYVGSCILTPHAGLKFEQELERFFVEFVGPDVLARFYADCNVAPADRNETYLLRNFTQLFNWYLGGSDVLLQFYSDNNRTANASANVTWLRQNIGSYISWSLERVDVKQRFYVAQQTPAGNRNDTYLAAHADEFITWLKGEIHSIAHFYADANVPTAQQSDAYLQQHFDQLVAWYQLEIQSDMQMVMLSEAYMKLVGTNYLSQSLGGFTTRCSCTVRRCNSPSQTLSASRSIRPSPRRSALPCGGRRRARRSL